MQSRYYNPEMGRFISADSYASTGQGVLGYNMYAYCGNNPVASADYEGEIPVAVGVPVGYLFAVAETAVAAVGAAAVAKDITQRSKTHTIYTLSNPNNQAVVYVGRTTDYKKRMKAHSLNPFRRDLVPTVLEENLTYSQARAAEQAYILYYCTLDRTNNAANQINGVNPKRPDYLDIMYNGFGLSEAIDSVLTNQLLILFE